MLSGDNQGVADAVAAKLGLDEAIGGMMPEDKVAFIKAMQGAGQGLPESGSVFISVNDNDKPAVLPVARDLAELGFRLNASRGTAAFLQANGLEVDVLHKVNEGRPNVADQIVNRKIDLVINTPLGRESFFDDKAVSTTQLKLNVKLGATGKLNAEVPLTPHKHGTSRKECWIGSSLRLVLVRSALVAASGGSDVASEDASGEDASGEDASGEDDEMEYEGPL